MTRVLDGGRVLVARERWPHGTLLSELGEDQAAALIRLGTTRSYGAGEIILLEGDGSGHVVILLRGAARVTGVSLSGGQTLLAIRVGGDIVGEQAALDRQPRSATVSSAGRSLTREIGRGDFLGFLHRHPEAALAVSRSLSAKLRRATRYRVDFGGTSVLVRLCRVVMELLEAHGRPVPEGVRIDAPLTQEDLAELASATKPSIERELRRLRSLGAIQTGYRSLVVTDPQVLLDLMSV